MPTPPCQPSPCGPNSQCRVFNQQAVCSCLENFKGSPPLCKPECTINSECRLNEACLNQRCVNPCNGVCGINALCHVTNHIPYCRCDARFDGNPFVECKQIPTTLIAVKNITNPCQPSPCGPFAVCQVQTQQTICSCLPNYQGSPPQCRPECITSSECSLKQACMAQKCRDPCPGLCGNGAECSVTSHTPSCVCPAGTKGDPFVQCIRQTDLILLESVNICDPSPCGINARCIQQNGSGTCQCLPNYFGDPYAGCQPECVLDADCISTLACQNLKCQDPCNGICGQNTVCTVLNHLPVCSCIPGYSGDPYSFCQLLKQRKINSSLIVSFF